MIKKQKIKQSLLVPLGLLLVMAATTSKANECDVVRQSAEQGRMKATVPLENIEARTVEKINRASLCVETFNQVAQKITLIPGGIDLSPAREVFRKTVCSVAERTASQAQSQVQSQIYAATGVNPQSVLSKLPPGPIAAPGVQGPPASTSIWGRVSCAIGNC